MKLFKRKAPVIILDEGVLSSKIVVLGTVGKKPTFGALRVCKYKDGELHEYDADVTEEDLGEPLVTILFGAREGIKNLADSLYNLYRVMGDREASE